LLSRFLGRRAAKHETRTDWRRRPLSKRQIEYALNDVRYLQPMRDAIHAQLVELGRLEWMAEEMASWQESVERSMSHERWRRVSGNAGLAARELAIIRELFHWRESEAQRRNQPIRRVLRDDLIVELARRGSADVERIRAVRGMERGDLRRRLGELAAAIQRGLDLPEEECPAQTVREHSPELPVLGQFLFAALGSRAREARIAPGMVGAPGDIREWLAFRARDRKAREKITHPPRLAQGSRAEFVGRLFDDLLDGKLSIRVSDQTSDHPLAFDPLPRAIHGNHA